MPSPIFGFTFEDVLGIRKRREEKRKREEERQREEQAHRRRLRENASRIYDDPILVPSHLTDPLNHMNPLSHFSPSRLKHYFSVDFRRGAKAL